MHRESVPYWSLPLRVLREATVQERVESMVDLYKYVQFPKRCNPNSSESIVSIFDADRLVSEMKTTKLNKTGKLTKRHETYRSLQSAKRQRKVQSLIVGVKNRVILSTQNNSFLKQYHKWINSQSE